MAAPAIFEKQIKIKLLHPAFTEEVTNSGLSYFPISSCINTVHSGNKL
ncbi:MAG: hypothetical protein P8X89_15815 [Reinekea sp.]